MTPPYGRPKSTCNATVENAAEVSQLNATKLTADDLSLVSERLYTGKTCASGGLCFLLGITAVGTMLSFFDCRSLQPRAIWQRVSLLQTLSTTLVYQHTPNVLLGAPARGASSRTSCVR